MYSTKNIAMIGTFVLCGLLLGYGIGSYKTVEQEQSITVSHQSETNKLEVEKLESKLEHLSDNIDVKSAIEVKAILEKKLPGMEINQIETSPMSGFYQAFLGGELIYVSNDSEYIFTGNLLQLAEGYPINHTQIAMANQDAKQAPLRAETIAKVDESEMIVYKSTNEQFVLTVFTDIDCAYCRKLHKEIPQLNEKGITVRYMAYPRAGIGSDSYNKLVSVWCADDKLAAMDDAKLRRQFGNFGQNSCENPISKQFDMTRVFNLSGTPTIILDDGEMIGGYLPAEDLYQHLLTKKTQKVAINID